MKYEVGDKVRVKSWGELVTINTLNKFTGSISDYASSEAFVKEMKEFCGKIFTISEVNDFIGYYRTRSNRWRWQDWMLEDIEVESTPVLDTIVIREVIIEPMEYVLSLLEVETNNPYLYPHNIRELALARTKLQEALFWMNEAYNKQSEEEAK